jgi:hypothetical protein
MTASLILKSMSLRVMSKWTGSSGMSESWAGVSSIAGERGLLFQLQNSGPDLTGATSLAIRAFDFGIIHLKILTHQAPVAHFCNPSYCGCRDRGDHSSKPAWANSFLDPISKNLITKKLGWWNGSRCRPWVQDLVPQKKKKSLMK